MLHDLNDLSGSSCASYSASICVHLRITAIAILHELRDMRIALQVGASARSPLQFGVCLRSSENYLVNDLGWLYISNVSRLT